MEKLCTSCNIIKPIIEFNNGNSKYGKESKCRNCKKNWRYQNIEYLKNYESSEVRKMKHLQREKNRRYLKKINGDGTIPRDLKKEHINYLLQLQNYKCGISGKSLIVDGKLIFHVDHKIPLIKGGKHSIFNIHLVLPDENLKKGIKLI